MLYLFDGSENLIQIIGRENVKAAEMTQEINNPETLTVDITPSLLDDKAVYIGHKNPVNGNYFHLYKIADITITPQATTIYGVQTAYDDLLADGYIKDRRFFDVSARSALEGLLEGSRWTVGNVNTERKVHTNFYYISRLEALQKLLAFNLEIKFRMIFSGNAIVGRYVDITDRLGEDRGKRYTHGAGLLHVEREEALQGIVTALVGRGKGERLDDEENPDDPVAYGRRITFKEVNWQKSKGDPANKPKGEEILELPEMTELFGYPDGKPRTAVITFGDIEEPEQLLQATYEHLVELCRPRVTYSAAVRDKGDTGLGDTVRIIRDDLGIRYATRIYKRQVNLLNPEQVRIELGDQIKDYSTRKFEAVKKEIEETVNAQQTYYQAFMDRISKIYWGTHGYNYDIDIEKAEELAEQTGNFVAAGLYSFDAPIESDKKTKYIYFGKGIMEIAYKDPVTGKWVPKTALTGEGLGTDLVAAENIQAGAIETKHITTKGLNADVIKLRSVGTTESLDSLITDIRAGYINLSSRNTIGDIAGMKLEPEYLTFDKSGEFIQIGTGDYNSGKRYTGYRIAAGSSFSNLNFTLDKKGHITAKGADIQGDLTTSRITITDGIMDMTTSSLTICGKRNGWNVNMVRFEPSITKSFTEMQYSRTGYTTYNKSLTASINFLQGTLFNDDAVFSENAYFKVGSNYVTAVNLKYLLDLLQEGQQQLGNQMWRVYQTLNLNWDGDIIWV